MNVSPVSYVFAVLVIRGVGTKTIIVWGYDCPFLLDDISKERHIFAQIGNQIEYALDYLQIILPTMEV